MTDAEHAYLHREAAEEITRLALALGLLDRSIAGLIQRLTDAAGEIAGRDASTTRTAAR